ncbi:MAG: hypothetical protein AAGK00_12365 [Pseudomonadota bacterium]
MRHLILALFFATFPVTDAVAKVLGRWQCTAQYQGVPLQGHYQLEYWTRSGIYVHTGRLQAANGTVYDFEVQSDIMAGVGGVWQNNQRHREVHMQFLAYRGGFRITTDRARVDARCAM